MLRAREGHVIEGPAFVTPHAIQRWRERVHADVTDEQARREILDALALARLRRVDESGIEHWRAGQGCRFGCVRLRLGRGEGPLPAVLTVLPEHAGWRPMRGA